MMGRVFSYR